MMVEVAEAQRVMEAKGILDVDLTRKLVDVLGSYCGILLEDTPGIEKGDLGEVAREQADQHLRELEVLQDLIEEYSENPNDFDIRYQKVDRDNGVFNAKLSRRNDPQFGDGEENAQVQLNLYMQMAQGSESFDDSTYAESVGADPHTAMIKRDDLHRGRVQVNTNRIYRDIQTGRTKVIPQAGIQVRVGKDGITQEGVKYVGTQPHVVEVSLRGGFTAAQARTLQELTVNLATERRQ